jgi:uncharacterized membrane protein
MEGQFCQKCGARAVDAGSAYIPPSAPIPPATPVGAAPGLSSNAAAALCYSFGFITGILFLVIAPYSQERRIRFHAMQSILLSVGVILLHIAITFASLMMHTMSFALGMMVSSLHLLVSFGFFLVWLYMMWKAYQGADVMLPIIGPIADRQAGTAPVSPGGTMGRAA